MGTADEVAVLLARLCDAPDFARAPVMRRLLRWLVEQTLAGRGDALRAYDIAVAGLGRPADFDAQSDSYPRVQVGRLRRMLDGHPAQGCNGLTLTIPSGGYRVVFVRDVPGDAAIAENAACETAEDPVAMRGRRWHILPVRGWLAAAGAGLATLLGLVWLAQPAAENGVVPAPTLAITMDNDAVPVSTRPGAGGPPVRDALTRLAELAGSSHVATLLTPEADRADYLLRVAPVDDRSGLALTLVRQGNGRVLWSDRVAWRDDTAGFDGRLLRRAAAVVAPFGVIATDQRRQRPDDLRPGYPCQLQFDRFLRDRQPERMTGVSACLEETVRLDTANAEALAALSFLEFDRLDDDGPRQARRRRERAATLARRAVAADPYSASALIADARVAVVEHNCVRGEQLVDRAIMREPYDPQVLAIGGLQLASCRPERAAQLMAAGRDLDPDLPSYLAALEVFLAVERGDAARAEAIARSMRPPGNGTRAQYLLGQMFADIARDRLDAARTRWHQIAGLAGMDGTRPDGVLGRYYFAPSLRSRVQARIEAAGVAGLSRRVGTAITAGRTRAGEGERT